jgi:V/A-type H+-transporting ATPase subunit C
MWAQLLDSAALEELITAPDIDAQVKLLTQGPYRPDIEATIIHGRNVANVVRALRANVGRTVQSVLKMLPAQGVGLVTAVIANGDIFDLKTIMRGVHSHVAQPEILDSLMPAATLTQAELEVLASAESVREVVDTLATWRIAYAKPLDAALGDYDSLGELAPMELALDRWYFARVARQLQSRYNPAKRLVAGVFGEMVDTENLRTAFRLIGAGLQCEALSGYWLEGGAHIDRGKFVSLCESRDIEDALTAIQRTPYSHALEDAAVTYLKEGTLSVLERALENRIAHRMIALRRPDPLGVGVVLAFLWAKQNEIANIRIAVIGRSVGLPEERMRRELILV